MVFGTTDDSSGETVYTAAVVCVRAPCFGLVGTVTAVDVDAGVLTVAVDEASGGLTGTVDILVTDDTRIVQGHRGTPGATTRLTLADVAVGDGVGVWGTDRLEQRQGRSTRPTRCACACRASASSGPSRRSTPRAA